MAISAVFRADFTNLVSELNKVEVKFEQFQHTTEDVQKTVARFADRFSGSKVIAEAEMMAAAIDKIGGASQLTEREARRVGASMAEALEKAQRTGQPVSDTMRKVAADTQQAATKGGLYSSVISGIGTAAKTALVSLGAMFAINQLISYGQRIVQLGGELTDLSAKTGLSTTALQQFQYAGGQVGVELETITAGVNMLQKRLAGDDKSAARAVSSLGVSFADLKTLSPEEQFKALAERIGSIEDPMLRTKAATDLFGRSGAELLPVLTKEFGALTEKASYMGIVMDEQTVASMDALGDVVSDLASQTLAALGRVLAPLIPVLSAMATTAASVANVLSRILSPVIEWVVGLFRNMQNAILDGARAMLQGLKTLSEMVPGFDRLTGASSKLTDAIGFLDTIQQQLNGTQQGVAPTTRAIAVETEAATKATSDHQKAVASLVKELSGAGAIEKLRLLEAGYQAVGGASKITAHEHAQLIKQLIDLRAQGVELTGGLADLFLAHQRGQMGALVMENGIRGLRDMIAMLGGSVDVARQRLEYFNAQILAKTDTSAGGTIRIIGQLGQAIRTLPAPPPDVQGAFNNLIQTFTQAATIGGDSFRGLSQWIGNVMAAGNTAADSVRALRASFDGLGQGGAKSAASLMNMASSGIALVSSMDRATGSGSTLQRAIGGVNTGFQAGNAILPGFGGAVGAVVGGVVGLARGLFGVSEETKKVRGEIAEFEANLKKNLTATQAADAAGRKWAETTIAVRDAYLLTGRSAAEAEAIVKRLWDEKNPQASRAAMEQINRVMEESKRIAGELNTALNGALREAVDLGVRLPDHLRAAVGQLLTMGRVTDENAGLLRQLVATSEPDFRRMQQAAQQFGIDLGALGPAFQQQRLDARAREILDAFDLLKRGGADVAGVIGGMSDEINDFVIDAMASGRTVPENMRPILETMIAQGSLTDANGQKLEDLGRINFGAPIESAFDRIIAKLQDLIDTISGGMGFDRAAAAAKRFATEATEAINDIPTQLHVMFGGASEQYDANQTFATGTLGQTGQWFNQFGLGTRALLHGEEAVVRRDQAGAFAAAFGGGGDTGTLEELRALRSDMMALPQHMARAVRDAILVAG